MRRVANSGETATTATSTVNVPVTVTIQPASDTLTILLAQYRISKQRLTVNATSTNPSAVVFMQAFNSAGTALTGRVQLTPVAGVGLQVILVGIGTPSTVVVTSSFGDQKTSGVTLRTN